MSENGPGGQAAFQRHGVVIVLHIDGDLLRDEHHLDLIVGYGAVFHGTVLLARPGQPS